MKDKISKLKNLVKKYGLAGTIKKAAGYIYSNYLVKLSVKERIYVAVNKKKFIEGIRPDSFKKFLRSDCDLEKFIWMGCAFVPKTSAYFQQFCEAKNACLL